MFPFYLGSSSQYNDNYQLWAGACEQEQPLQPPTGTGFASVNPGQAASVPPTFDATVDEPAIDVAVKYNGTVHVPSHVSIIFTGWNATGTTQTCSDTWHSVAALGPDTVAGTTYSTYPAPFASTAAKGNPTASNTGDPGRIQVCADYNYTGTSYKHVTTPTSATSGFTVTNFNAPTMIPVITLPTSGGSGACP